MTDKTPANATSQDKIATEEVEKRQVKEKDETAAKAKVQVETRDKERKIFVRLSEKKRLSDTESTILELGSNYAKLNADEKSILHTLLKTLIDEDEAKAAARRKTRASKKLAQAQLDELHDNRSRRRANHALHVVDKLFELGILNADATYNIPANIFYNFLETNLHLLAEPHEAD